ncbi:MAG: phBC6A51 family helix-turn-helix protein [Methanosarcina sp.]|nr:phBC6A51 family helix-turn-helix protein [Methanosarcina sp.]
MAVQKKKKKVQKTVTKSKVFSWTPQRKQAAKLLSEGLYNYETVADMVHIHHKTLWEWRKYKEFLDEVDRLTLENDLVRRAGILRECLYGLDIKRKHIEEDNNTHLHYVKMIADIQGHIKQKVEMDANLKHDVNNPAEMTDDELKQAIEYELRKLVGKGNLPGNSSE